MHDAMQHKAFNDALSYALFTLEYSDSMKDVTNDLYDMSVYYDDRANRYANRSLQSGHDYTYNRDMSTYYSFKSSVLDILATQFHLYAIGKSSKTFPWDASSFIYYHIS